MSPAPGEPGWVGHEWKPLSFSSDECAHCGVRAYLVIGPCRDSEHCETRALKQAVSTCQASTAIESTN